MVNQGLAQFWQNDSIMPTRHIVIAGNYYLLEMEGIAIQYTLSIILFALFVIMVLIRAAC